MGIPCIVSLCISISRGGHATITPLLPVLFPKSIEIRRQSAGRHGSTRRLVATQWWQNSATSDCRWRHPIPWYLRFSERTLLAPSHSVDGCPEPLLAAPPHAAGCRRQTVSRPHRIHIYPFNKLYSPSLLGVYRSHQRFSWPRPIPLSFSSHTQMVKSWTKSWTKTHDADISQILKQSTVHPGCGKARRDDGSILVDVDYFTVPLCSPERQAICMSLAV